MRVPGSPMEDGASRGDEVLDANGAREVRQGRSGPCSSPSASIPVRVPLAGCILASERIAL